MVVNDAHGRVCCRVFRAPNGIMQWPSDATIERAVYDEANPLLRAPGFGEEQPALVRD